MGELHLEVLVDRMLREFSVDANVGKPQVAYRETIRKKVAKVELSPHPPDRWPGPVRARGHRPRAQPPGKGTSRGQDPVGSTPREYIPFDALGIRESMTSGVLAGYPTVDIKVTLTFGSFHDVDSSEMAFKIAGSMAFKKAANMASPVLLEPVMAVEVITPEDYMGDVIGDLSARRGKVEGMEQRGTSQIVRAQVPLIGHVRLRYRPAFSHAGPGHVLDAVPCLQRGSRVDRQGDHRQGAWGSRRRPNAGIAPAQPADVPTSAPVAAAQQPSTQYRSTAAAAPPIHEE